MGHTSANRSEISAADLDISESDLIRQIHIADEHQLAALVSEINSKIKHARSSEEKFALKRCRQRAYDCRRKIRYQKQLEETTMSGNDHNLVELPVNATELSRNQQSVLDGIKDLRDILEHFRASNEKTGETWKELAPIEARLNCLESRDKRSDQLAESLSRQFQEQRDFLSSLAQETASKTEEAHLAIGHLNQNISQMQTDILSGKEEANKTASSLADKVAQIKSDLISTREESALQTAASSQNFSSDFWYQVTLLNGRTFVRHFPLALMLTALAALASWFVADQVTPLYEAFKFDQPSLAAWGSVAMAVGFSGLYGALRSKPAATMCIIVALYEGLFVLAGTHSHEKLMAIAEIESKPVVQFAHSALKKAKSEYEKNQSRYENPKDKVYQNSWFKSKHMEPSWKKYSEKLSEYKSMSNSLIGSVHFSNPQVWLKLLYRLCSVILAMIFTGMAIAKIRSSFTFA